MLRPPPTSTLFPYTTLFRSGEYPERVGMRAPRPERRGHGLDLGPRRIPVLDRALSHRGSEKTVRVRFAPLDGVLARGVAPHARGDLEARDAGPIEQRAQMPAHLRLAAVAVPRSQVGLHEAVDPRISRPVGHR